MAQKVIEIDEIREAGPDGGDLMGYFARGHVDRYQFAQAANAFSGADSEWDRRHVRAAKVRHEWWRTVPIAGEPGFTQFLSAEPHSRGAYPVTVCDELAQAALRQAQHEVNEYHRGKASGVADGVNWAYRWLLNRDEGSAEALIEAYRAPKARPEVPSRGRELA